MCYLRGRVIATPLIWVDMNLCVPSFANVYDFKMWPSVGFWSVTRHGVVSITVFLVHKFFAKLLDGVSGDYMPT